MIESILSKLSEVSERYVEIENLLSQPDITSNQENYIKLSKEYSELSPIVKAFKDYEQSESSLDDARQLVKDADPEIREMAEIEIKELTSSIQTLEIDIKRLLLPKDPDDSKDVFLEVRAGAGGDEAALFAGDLFRMYSRLAERNNE
jgi:Protein chain release factor A